MQAVDFKKFIFVEVGHNSNKVWEIYLYSDGSVQTKWGRVGKGMQETDFTGGRKTFEKKVAEKKKKGYTEIETLEVKRSGGELNLKEVAKKQIKISHQ